MTPSYTYAATITGVVDADTCDVVLDLGMRVKLATRLRIAHIDAPERYTTAGRVAMDFAKELLPVGSSVTVATHKPDKFGRSLADVVLADGRDVADELVRAGHAVPYEGGTR